LKATGRRLRIVSLHHPLVVRHSDDEPQRVPGADDIVRRWAAAGADLVLGGHIHDPFVVAMHERLDGLPRRL
jgi:hypothetical protein